MFHVMARKASTRTPVERYRDRMRKNGLRLVQLWVADSSRPGFTEECRRQSRAAARKRRAEADVLAWIGEVQDTEGWTS
jgi:hypothetical protein